MLKAMPIDDQLKLNDRAFVCFVSLLTLEGRDVRGLRCRGLCMSGACRLASAPRVRLGGNGRTGQPRRTVLGVDLAGAVERQR